MKSKYGHGNDTIDRYPLPYEGKLTKLLCISKAIFEKLKAALVEFGVKPKPASLKPKAPFQQKPPRKEPLGGHRNDDFKTAKDKSIGSFKPSNIFNIQNSRLWRLRNLNAWFKEQESYEDPRYLKTYAIKI